MGICSFTALYFRYICIYILYLIYTIIIFFLTLRCFDLYFFPFSYKRARVWHVKGMSPGEPISTRRFWEVQLSRFILIYSKPFFIIKQGKIALHCSWNDKTPDKIPSCYQFLATA